MSTLAFKATYVCVFVRFTIGYSTSEVSFFTGNKDGLGAPIIVDGYICSTDEVYLANCSITYEYGTLYPSCINVVGVMCECELFISAR